jgi:ribosome maturation factor RimP
MPTTQGRVSTSVTPELGRELSETAASFGCEVLSADLVGGTFRVVLDRRDRAVTLDDCQQVSRQLSPLLDVFDFGSGRYVLEVSSPGLDRPLHHTWEWERFVGSLVKVTWQDDAEPQGATTIGRLESYGPDRGGEIEIHEPESDKRYRIQLSSIKRARLEPEL